MADNLTRGYRLLNRVKARAESELARQGRAGAQYFVDSIDRERHTVSVFDSDGAEILEISTVELTRQDRLN